MGDRVIAGGADFAGGAGRFCGDGADAMACFFAIDDMWKFADGISFFMGGSKWKKRAWICCCIEFCLARHSLGDGMVVAKRVKEKAASHRNAVRRILNVV